jgi:hypothetical protein
VAFVSADDGLIGDVWQLCARTERIIDFCKHANIDLRVGLVDYA